MRIAGETLNEGKGQVMGIRRVGVLGCGLIGLRYSQVTVAAGFNVAVLEVEQRFLDKGFASIANSLAKLAEKGKLQGSAEARHITCGGTCKQNRVINYLSIQAG